MSSCGLCHKRIDAALAQELLHHKNVVQNRTQKKLCNLYGGWVPIPAPEEGFVNLSKVKLTEKQTELLNLGINFQFSPRFSTHDKKAELEILYQDKCKLGSQQKIAINPNLQEQLQAEGTINRIRLTKSSLDLQLHLAAKELKTTLTS